MPQETPTPANNVVQMSDYRNSPEFHVPEAKDLYDNVVSLDEYRQSHQTAEADNAHIGAEALRDTLEATPNGPVTPVIEWHDGVPYVRTVEGGLIKFNPHQENYESTKAELASESQEIFKAALDIMKARETLTGDMLSEPVSVVPPAYLNTMTEEKRQAA